ncbi:hypothetical protein AGMMS49944_29350 [Spirochaetia bacterium]|nr:hypothetical protein AGMMS49944_29350 [Spirochaetia bacterium]
MAKEPWENSTEKAKALTVEDFGTLDEVKEMARPIRSAYTRQEATNILNQIAKNGPLTSKTGLTAVLPNVIFQKWSAMWRFCGLQAGKRTF